MPLRELVTLLVYEGRRRILVLAIIFGVIALGVLVGGLLMPKKWDASTLIVADARDIIKPLLEGRAVPTTIADQTPIVTQVMGTRRILREVATFGGWPLKVLTPAQEDRLLKHIKTRIKIETTRDDTIRISYFDSDPQRAYRITNKLAKIFIRESTTLKETQSRDAFDFISRRVKEYADKMAEAHEKLLLYYRGEGSRSESSRASGAAALARTTPGAEGEGERPRTHISPEELAELRAEEATLTAQLARKRAPATAPGESRQAEDQYRTRVLQLQSELDRLRSTYTEQHPDVVRTQRELKSTRDELARVEQVRADHDKAAAQAASLDDDVIRAAAARLDDVQQKISAATGTPRRRGGGGHLAAAVAAAPTPNDLEMKGVGQDTILSELVRRYEATRDVYQDLLKRRENARVSMDLDAEHRGLTLRVQEAAEFPVTASSVRLLYVAGGGLVAAAVLPLVLLFGLIKLDPRVRSGHQIERMIRLPLLVTIPGGVTPQHTAQQRTHWLIAASIVVGVFVIYAAAFVMKAQTSS